MSNDNQVTALLEERRGYVTRGLKNRVAQVDAELAKFGVEVASDGDDIETATTRRGRKS